MPLHLDRGGRVTPLHCHRCAAEYRHNYTAPDAVKYAAKGLRLERGQQQRRLDNKLRRVVTVTCPNGHEWWSRHPDALRRSRNRDSRGKIKADRIVMDRLQRGARR